MNEFLSFGMRKIANRVPGLLRRWLFPIVEVRDQIKIELRGDAPITPWVGDNAEIVPRQNSDLQQTLNFPLCSLSFLHN